MTKASRSWRMGRGLLVLMTCLLTGNAWVGEALAARLMRAVAAWNHDAFFDYVDRWMSDEDARIARRRPGRNSFQGRAWDPYVTNMWQAYRAQCPDQPGAAENRKWVWTGGGKWVPNPKPAATRIAKADPAALAAWLDRWQTSIVMRALGAGLSPSRPSTAAGTISGVANAALDRARN